MKELLVGVIVLLLIVAAAYTIGTTLQPHVVQDLITPTQEPTP